MEIWLGCFGEGRRKKDKASTVLVVLLNSPGWLEVSRGLADRLWPGSEW